MVGTAAKTIVTIKGPNGDFQGKIKSPDAGCLGDRVVRLFMSDTADGPFERTGNSDTSQQQGDVGEWSLGNTGLRDGFFVREGQGDDRPARAAKAGCSSSSTAHRSS